MGTQILNATDSSEDRNAGGIENKKNYYKCLKREVKPHLLHLFMIPNSHKTSS